MEDYSYIDKLIIKEALKVYGTIKKDVMSPKDFMYLEKLSKKLELDMKVDTILGKFHKETV